MTLFRWEIIQLVLSGAVLLKKIYHCTQVIFVYEHFSTQEFWSVKRKELLGYEFVKMDELEP